MLIYTNTGHNIILGSLVVGLAVFLQLVIVVGCSESSAHSTIGDSGGGGGGLLTMPLRDQRNIINQSPSRKLDTPTSTASASTKIPSAIINRNIATPASFTSLSSEENIFKRRNSNASSVSTTSVPLATLDRPPAQALQPHKSDGLLSRSLQLFQQFAYKGVGLAVGKSLVRWNGVSISMSMPITAHFPQYDRVVYFPRLASSIACNYPFSVKLKISATLPLRGVMTLIGMLVETLQLVHKDTIDGMFAHFRPSDSVRRVGMTWMLRYSHDSGWRYTKALDLGYMADRQFVADHLLNLLVTPPATACSLVEDFWDGGMSMDDVGDQCHNYNSNAPFDFNHITKNLSEQSAAYLSALVSQNSSNPRVWLPQTSHPGSSILSNVSSPSNLTLNNSRLFPPLHVTEEAALSKQLRTNARKQSWSPSKRHKSHSVVYWKDSFKKWALDKSMRLSMGLAFFRNAQGEPQLGSSVKLGVQQLFPIRALTQQIVRLIQTIMAIFKCWFGSAGIK